MTHCRLDTHNVFRGKFNPYPIYKHSGIEWLGRIPARWEVKRLKHLLVEPLKYGANEPAEHTEHNLPRYIRITDIREEGTLRDDSFRSLPEDIAKPYLLVDGDILFARSGATVGKTFRYHPSWGKAAYAGYLIRARLDKFKAESNFVEYFTRSQGYAGWLQNNFIQATIQNVSAERYASLRISIPPLPEQCAIAAFLDRETARIDALVAKKERLIELLKEKRAVLISHAVTRGLPADAAAQAGLDPDAPMKDSGVEWLGEVPAHWEVKRLRSAIKFQRGHDLPSDDREEGDVPVVSSSGISAMHSKAVATAPGIVTGRCGTIGQFYLINQSYWPHNTALYSIDLHGNKPRFLRYMLIHMSPLFCLHSIKSAVPAVDRNDIHADYTTVPPLPEQRAIADFLDRETAKIDALVGKVREAIDRLKELRSALISAAVTGKIDVREAPARVPDKSGTSTEDGSVMPGASGGMGRRDETRRIDL